MSKSTKKVYLTEGEGGFKFYSLAPNKTVEVDGITEGYDNTVLIKRRTRSMNIEGMKFHYARLPEEWNDTPLDEMGDYGWTAEGNLDTQTGDFSLSNA